MDLTLAKDEIKCVACKGIIDPTETHYECEETLCGSRMCEPCYFEEEFHKHVLHRVKGSRPETLRFTYKDPRTQNTIYLGEYTTAVPGSRTLKKFDIKSVLSVLNFSDTRQQDGMDKIRDVFKVSGEDGRNSKTNYCQGVLYHHIDLQDFTNPEQVKNWNLPTLFAESVTFIEDALKRGNVLVHCERGERRSPTMVLAFLISRGKTTDEAIGRVNRGYLGDETWARTYKKYRATWVTKLRKFEKMAPKILEFYRRTETSAIALWTKLAQSALDDLERLKEEQAQREQERADAREEDDDDNDEDEDEDNSEDDDEEEEANRDDEEVEDEADNDGAEGADEEAAPAEPEKPKEVPKTEKKKLLEVQKPKYTPQSEELKEVLKPFKSSQQTSLSGFLNGSKKSESDAKKTEKRKLEELAPDQLEDEMLGSSTKKARLSLPGQ